MFERGQRFSLYHGRSPAILGVEDVRAYQVHLVQRRIAWASLNQIVSALRFVYGITHAVEVEGRECQ